MVFDRFLYDHLEWLLSHSSRRTKRNFRPLSVEAGKRTFDISLYPIHTLDISEKINMLTTLIISIVLLTRDR